MLPNFINIQYCYNYLIDQIPVGLLLYSHIPTAIVALLFGGYVLFKVRKLPSITLFIVCLSFAAWCLFDLISWFAYLGSDMTMFSWSLVDLFAVIFFFFSYYFLYSFISKDDLPIWQKIMGFCIMLPTAVWTFLGSNLVSYDGNTCASIEADWVTKYPYFIEGIFIVLSLVFVIRMYKKTTEKKVKREVLLAGAGVITFLTFFFSSTLLVNLLISGDASLYVYNFEIYGLFGMPVLLAFLGYLVVKYQAFDLKALAAQALVAALLVLIGAEFFFVTTLVSRVLVGATLFFSFIAGYFLVRSVRREIEARNLIQQQRNELEKANVRLKELDTQKSEFLSFATHQIRSPLASMKGYASILLEGDAGPLSADARGAVETILTSTKTLSIVVEDYLNITRIELGTMKYDMKDIDFATLLTEVVNEQKPNIDAKGLALSVSVDASQTYPIKADLDKFKQVLMNTIDNSVKYTPKGSIAVSLEKDAAKGMIRFIVRDTGVGIAPDVMPKLFRKFSRASNASEANIHGTGLGLYIAKEIVNAHGGKMWAESDGEGKGSRFVVEMREGR
jgi:signal transduction histidine kinase